MCDLCKGCHRAWHPLKLTDVTIVFYIVNNRCNRLFIIIQSRVWKLQLYSRADKTALVQQVQARNKCLKVCSRSFPIMLLSSPHVTVNSWTFFSIPGCVTSYEMLCMLISHRPSLSRPLRWRFASWGWLYGSRCRLLQTQSCRQSHRIRFQRM